MEYRIGKIDGNGVSYSEATFAKTLRQAKRLCSLRFNQDYRDLTLFVSQQFPGCFHEKIAFRPNVSKGKWRDYK